MSVRTGAALGLLCVGGLFFLAGTVGLLRFPDVHARLHAVTKADNLGLGFLCAGLALDAARWDAVLRLGITWGLVLVSSSLGSQLLARVALDISAARRGRAP